MKITTRLRRGWQFQSRIIFVALLISLAQAVHAVMPPEPGGSFPTPLDSWSFSDHTNWTDDNGNPPISFTNISWCQLGDGSSLIVETNIPAWLNYGIYGTNGATNVVLNGPGSITFWFGPGWTTTNGGPGDWAQLIDIGQWTSNSSVGYFGLSTDPSGSNILFLAQDGSGNEYSLSAPISWTTNYFHFAVLTYSSTNVSLYLDGQLATNDLGGLSVWPDTNVFSGGIYFGSDQSGNYLANGLFNTVATYNSVLDSNTVQEIYNSELTYYEISPWNIPYMDALGSAPSSPSYTPTYEAVTGTGNLSWVASASSCVDGSSAYDVWITNVSATISGTGSNNMSLTFTIEGGEPNVPYDVFANSVLHFGTNGIPWAWMGQGYQCNTYTLTNLPSTDCFIILGTPQDSSGSGLTDAYEWLVLQTSPYGPQSDSYGVPYAWYAQHGLTTLTNGLATADPDQDGILNYQEYLYGTNPQVSEGFAIWVSTPNGTSSIP
ncbi:MAG TPA: LamG-like jellyroll fold domain-containing protein [Candidatus Sulfotelmatobacter sp.]|nr:LamG-like jellyroll fold domain-containing protein [Candidatus Sulfotelmatobacter sp.]